MSLSMIKLIVSISSIWIGAVRSQNRCDILLPNANVYCISPTEFTVAEPNCNSTKFSCPAGLLCTDVEQICSEAGPAACKLSRACKSCPPNALSACVSNKQYVNCINGKPDTNIKNCRASRPYCTMEYSDDGNIAVECSNQIKDIACLPEDEACPTVPPPTNPPTTNPPQTTPSLENQCTKPGKFKIIGDPTCKMYFYCYYNYDDEEGDLKRLDFICPYKTLFNHNKTKCVTESGNFECR